MQLMEVGLKKEALSTEDKQLFCFEDLVPPEWPYRKESCCRHAQDGSALDCEEISCLTELD